MQVYNFTSFQISKLITRNYSTSFYWSSLFFKKEIKEAIFSLYAFVRLADEIVDSFHGFDKEFLLSKFESDFDDALDKKISLNPVLQSFCCTVEKYVINKSYIKSFFQSMKLDLSKTSYSSANEINQYIYGSAEVIGLICLKIFCSKNEALFSKLEKYAVKLGSAFQKVNFLRDLQNDMESLHRVYFPNLKKSIFNDTVKFEIIADIETDFRLAKMGIELLPGNSRLAVTIAYFYYHGLLQKLKKTPANVILEKRLRISNYKKLFIIVKSLFIYYIFKKL